MSRRQTDALVARLRRNQAALIMAGGRLPENPWAETLDYRFGLRPPGSWKWHLVSEHGLSNIGSRWPVALILNAPDLYFRYDSDGRCNVEITP